MKFLRILFLLCLFSSCSPSYARMTYAGYSGIEVGMPIVRVQEEYGRPYRIHSRMDDAEAYEYIERIEMGEKTIEQRRYFLLVSGGKVVGKCMKVSAPLFEGEGFPEDRWDSS